MQYCTAQAEQLTMFKKSDYCNFEEIVVLKFPVANNGSASGRKHINCLCEGEMNSDLNVQRLM
jgi:hypothetical protein